MIASSIRFSSQRLLLAAITALLGSVAAADDFRDALAQAYRLNPAMTVAQSQLSAGDENVAIALAAMRPNVLSVASYGAAVFDDWEWSNTSQRYSPGNQGTPNVFRYNDQRIGYLDGQQTLYSSGGLEAQVRSNQAQVQSLRGGLKQTEQQVLLNVIRETEADLKRQLANNRLQFARKDITVTDLGQTESRVAQAEANRVDAENAVQAAEVSYRVVIGVMPSATEQQALPEIPGVPARLEDALAKGGVDNPTIAAAIGSRDAAVASIAVQQAGALPNVSVEYQGLFATGSSSQSILLEQEAVLGWLNVPLYVGGAVGAKVRAARNEAAAAQSGIDEAQRNVVQSTVEAWYKLLAAGESLASSKEGVEASGVALRGVLIGRDHGYRTVLDVLNARGELEQARITVAQAEHDRILAQLQLLAAAGSLNVASLAVPVTPYDPQPHYERVTKRWSDWAAEP